MGWWIGDMAREGEYPRLLSWIVWVLFSITVHELAHGWAAIWEGDDTPKRLNRMTFNPIVQMGPMSLIVFAICGIAWGAMPVNPAKFRHRKFGDLIVSLAGPVSNLLLALIALIAFAIWIRVATPETAFTNNVNTFLYVGIALNIVLAMFNMLPVPPLDGSRILASLSPAARRLYNGPNAQMFSLFFVMAIFLTPIGSILFSVGYGTAHWLIQLTLPANLTF